MSRMPLFAALIALGVTSAYAQNAAVIKERKALLGDIGKSVKQPTKASKGEEPFDLASVQAALKTIAANTEKLPALFADDAKTGGDTEALPAIWDDKADFEDRFKKLNAAAVAAQASITDEISLQEQWKDVLGHCSGCHKKYRLKKEK